MQIGLHAITTSQDGGAAGMGPAAALHGFPVAPWECGGPGVRFVRLLPGFLQPRMRAAGAGPGGHCTWPRGGALGWDSRTQGDSMVGGGGRSQVSRDFARRVTSIYIKIYFPNS